MKILKILIPSFAIVATLAIGIQYLSTTGSKPNSAEKLKVSAKAIVSNEERRITAAAETLETKSVVSLESIDTEVAEYGVLSDDDAHDLAALDKELELLELETEKVVQVKSETMVSQLRTHLDIDSAILEEIAKEHVLFHEWYQNALGSMEDESEREEILVLAEEYQKQLVNDYGKEVYQTILAYDAGNLISN